MDNLLNPANYDIPADYNYYVSYPKLKFFIEDIDLSLKDEGKVYLAKVELQIPRECDAEKYFLNITMQNMYHLKSGTHSLDYIRNKGS